VFFFRATDRHKIRGRESFPPMEPSRFFALDVNVVEPWMSHLIVVAGSSLLGGA